MKVGPYRSADGVSIGWRRMRAPILWWHSFPECPICGAPLTRWERHNVSHAAERADGELEPPGEADLVTTCRCGQIVFMAPRYTTPWWRRCVFMLPVQIRRWVRLEVG